MKVDPRGLELRGGSRATNCKGPNWLQGWRSHSTFKNVVQSQERRPVAEFNNTYGGIFHGRPDAYSPPSGKVWELKPTTWGDGAFYSAADIQLSGYILSANTNSGGTFWSRGEWNDLFPDQSSVTGHDPMTGQTFKYEPDSPQYSGLIFYSCEPEPQQCSASDGMSGLPRLP